MLVSFLDLGATNLAALRSDKSAAYLQAHMPVMGHLAAVGLCLGQLYLVAAGTEVAGIPLMLGTSLSVVMFRPSFHFSIAE